MVPSLFAAALTIAIVGGQARCVAVIYAWLRTFLVRKRFVRFRFGWVETLTNFEPLLLLAVTYVLFRTVGTGDVPTYAQAFSAVLGAALVIVGWSFLIWAVLSWPSIFAGHAVLADHELLTRGAYSVVRHPAYLAAILIWLGLGVAFANAVVLVISVLYVIPIYVLYLRAEEAMMLETFGEKYADYRQRVPMLVPRLTTKRPGGQE